MNLSLHADRRLYGPDGGTRYLWVRLEAPRASAARPDRAPLDIGLVLDRSGSMSGDKITLAKKAAREVINVLREQDGCALIAYDMEVLVATPRGLVDAAHRDRLRQSLASFDARGNTDLFGGWMAGAEQVSDTGPGRIRRVLLLTDGLANHGLIDHDQITGHVRELSRRGVGTSTFGVGRDFDEVLLGAMADAGAGHFYYIERPEQIPDYLASELGELLTVAATGVTLEIRVEGATIDNLNDFNATAGIYHIGDLSEGSETDVLFALEPGADHVRISVSMSWTDATAQAVRRRDATLTLRRATAAECAAETPDEATLRQALTVRRARTNHEALRHNHRGEYAQAGARVSREYDAMRSLAQDLPEAAAELAGLDEMSSRMSMRMDAGEKKRQWFEAQLARKSRRRPEDRQPD